ncbi:hypothetical protein ES708_14082 [subsurface metagenome]
MKKIILLTMILVFLTGCGIFNPGSFVVPDDIDFLNVVESLQTPKEVCQYMLDNFGYEDHPYNTLTPYQLYKNKAGDCNDFSLFAVFTANQHGYETWQILIKFYPHVFGYNAGHTIGVFKEEGGYSISEGRYYIGGFGRFRKNFREIVDFNYQEGWEYYIVYNYWNEVVEEVYND